ncbi:hypothetical protein GA0061077_1211 [Bifidobacterium commune]|uniref:Uncharacterized protein n=1 Tax=Bifidobacterium commune TaxID=1505727 RepID=A0A1C4H6J0_9BIFI|nr:hypothetical protein GA0061077_1211 [Bifidobacterium commune]
MGTLITIIMTALCLTIGAVLPAFVPGQETTRASMSVSQANQAHVTTQTATDPTSKTSLQTNFIATHDNSPRHRTSVKLHSQRITDLGQAIQRSCPQPNHRQGHESHPMGS